MYAENVYGVFLFYFSMNIRVCVLLYVIVIWLKKKIIPLSCAKMVLEFIRYIDKINLYTANKGLVPIRA